MSMPQQTIMRLRELRLHTMADAYQLQLDQPSLHQIPFDDRFGNIVEYAASCKESALLKRLMKAADFPETASLEELDFEVVRGLDRTLVASLGSCEWIRRCLNLAILGPTGMGKTWIACAFGMQACRLKMSTVFWSASRLWEAIRTADIDGSLGNFKASLIRPALLILDDFGIEEISAVAGRVLLDVVDRRQKSGSLLITSQLPSDQWHTRFPDPTIADALLDRIVHRSYKLQLKGESMRKIQAKKQMGDE